MAARWVAISILSLISLYTYGQVVVTKVETAGLAKTKASYILQFIETKPGDILDSVRVAADEQRIANLGIVVSKGWSVQQEGDDAALIFELEELVNTLPVFALGKTGDTFWCRAGVQSLNLTGHGDRLFLYYQYYDRHSVYFNYAIDRIRQSRWGFTALAVQWATLEPLATQSSIENLEYTNRTLYGGATYAFTFRESVEMGIGFFNERFANPNNVTELNALVEGDKTLSKLIFKSNRLDYEHFYISGFYNQFNAEFIHAFDGQRNFFTAFHEFRYFTRLTKKLNWASRVRAGISTNHDTPFAPFVLDSYLNIRGAGNRVDRGTGSMVINTELRATLWDSRLLAMQAIGFVDFGAWRQPGGNWRDFTKSENMRALTGAGARIIYKRAFDTMPRVDWGFDYKGRSGVVVGIGQYF